MATDATLGDVLAGAAGRPVNRTLLNATVQQGQALAGLRTAQTEDALMNAAKMRDQQGANDRLEDSLFNVLTSTGDPHAREHARYGRDVMVGGHGNSLQAEQAFGDILKNINTQTLSDPTQLGSPAQTAAQQGITGHVATPVNVPNNYTTLPGGFQPNVQQTPNEQATTSNLEAEARLHNAQADAGGFNPHSGAFQNVPPDQLALLQKAVEEGRLDPSRLNSRTAPIFAELEARNPGGVNYNRMIADAALQRNPTFQQKAMTMEALPTIMTHMTSLGKKVGYSDWRTVGKMQQFMNGEFNDPDYAEYMSVRNDVLMNIANVMRGVGMSDQAHKAEMEAAAPTMSPLALDGWLKGQMSSLQPRLEQQRRVTHLGDQKNPQGTGPQGGGGGNTPNGNDPLGIR